MTLVAGAVMAAMTGIIGGEVILLGWWRCRRCCDSI